MSLAGQWLALQEDLPEGWSSTALRFEARDAETAERAAALLGPAQPYRASRTTLRFSAARDGSAPSPDSITRLLRRLDDARVIGTLEVAGSQAAPAREEPLPASLVKSWDEALARLPADWSDLYGEIRLLSSDYIERGALLCVPLNPRRDGKRLALRFRCARRAGYGAAPQMVRRCLARCDAEPIRGSVAVLRVLSDTQLVATQGPTWLLDGMNV